LAVHGCEVVQDVQQSGVHYVAEHLEYKEYAASFREQLAPFKEQLASFREQLASFREQLAGQSPRCLSSAEA
jgi:exoribonuclease R